jgi:glucose/mannose-6-phosphate isomerase
VSVALDSLGMLDAHASLPEQVAAAARAARGLDHLPRHEEIENVLVLGMGGSGVAGDVLVSAAGPFLPVPVVVTKGYVPPNFVSETTLVFAISASGNTEETIEALSEAAVQGGRVVIVTQGGELAHLAESWGAPMVRVPSDIVMPRAALGAVAIPPLVILEEVGLFPGASQWIDLAVEQLSSRRDRLVKPGSLAEEIAHGLARTIPLVYGDTGIGGTAAMRWKTQVNENAKSPAFWAQHPELCHNEICGWGQHGDLTRQAISLVNLRHDFEHPQVSRRFELVSEMLQEVVAGVTDVVAEGEGQLAQLLDLILIGDLVSVHLALVEGIDPGPIPVLEDLKAALAKG